MEGGDLMHPRLILHNFLSLNQCKELEFIHKSSSAVGYRPHVLSTTLSHLIATNCAHLIMPFVPIRESLKEKVEEYFGCEYELCIEFTGLISWTEGASIGWHSDDNRPYLKQRDFAAVCYLNSHGEDFTGGLFHFQDGEPAVVEPMAGDVLLYTADAQNIHAVDEITSGERLTLTLWFSRDSSYDEDTKLISALSPKLVPRVYNELHSCLPLPAPSNMYWFLLNQISNERLGFDICCARVHVLGYDLYSSKEQTCNSAPDLWCDYPELLMERIQLARGDQLFEKEFSNILHALQVLEFYCWKAPNLQTSEVDRKMSNTRTISKLQREKMNNLKLRFLKNPKWAEAVFPNAASEEDEHPSPDWAGFSAAIVAWEVYTKALLNAMLTSFPHWNSHQVLFSVPLIESSEET